MPKKFKDDESTIFEAYAGFARTLRNWLIAYGVGLPIIIFSSERLTNTLIEAKAVLPIAANLLWGIGIQVLITILYKTSLWYMYKGEIHKTNKETWFYRIANNITDQYWLELITDLITIALFFNASLLILKALA